MIELSVTNLRHGFEVGQNIFEDVTFQVDTGERVGLLGHNGAGKTTLFRMICGELEPDGGSIQLARGCRVGLISQIPVYPEGYTVEDVLRTAFARLQEMEQEMARLAGEMADKPEDGALLARYDELTAEYEHAGGYDTATPLNKVTAGLGISQEMRGQDFAALSGGEKTRVNLARLILENTDLLLLDEPTNHLDLHATEWLEGYLDQFKGTVLAISHDRYFLDRVVKRIVELEEGKAHFYPGNYSFYVVEKRRRFEEQLKRYEKEQAKVEQLRAAAEKMHLWAFMGNDKLHKRAFSMEKRMEKLQTVDKPREQKTMSVGFDAREFHGDEVFSTIGLSKSFGERTLFQDVNLVVAGGERIALLGDNGTGKSTFLKLLLGEETPTSGKVRFGPTVKVGYLPQQVVFDHPERNLVDTMLYGCNCSVQEARDRLAAFLFRGEDVFKSVDSLSGGEKSRLKLCMLMDERINLLILDEPTNHLDIASREWIEGAVADFPGALLLVSHDRYFIDRFARRVWTIEDGHIRDYKGTFQEYRAYLERQEQLARTANAQKPSPTKEHSSSLLDGGGTTDQPSPARKGGTKYLEKEVAAAERAVAKAEEEMYELTQAIDEAASDYLKLQELYQQREELDDKIRHLYTQWETLAQELEEAKG